MQNAITIRTSRIYNLLKFNILAVFMPQKITITKNSIEITKYENLIFFWDTVVNKMLFSEISVSNPDAGIIWDKLSLVSRGGEVISVSGLKKRDMKKILKIINYTTSH